MRDPQNLAQQQTIKNKDLSPCPIGTGEALVQHPVRF
jgi:hypothetical protein